MSDNILTTGKMRELCGDDAGSDQPGEQAAPEMPLPDGGCRDFLQ